MHFPLNNEALRKLQGFIGKRSAFQAVIGTGTVLFVHNSNPILSQTGTIGDLYYMVGVKPASGESIVLDVKKSSDGGGTWATILSSTVTIGSTASARVQVPIKSSVLAAKLSVAEGDMLRAELTYTAGSTPAPAANLVVVAEIYGLPY